MTQLQINRTDFISDRDLEALASFVLDDAGIVIQPHQYDRLRRIARAACDRFELQDVATYLLRLRNQHAFSAEREFLIAGVTIGESYFFRDENQIKFLKDVWIPRIREQKKSRGSSSIHVWSAGCSNGQEAYTLAILLQEAIPDIDNWDVRILATDINTEVLRTGMTGRYSDWSFRATPEQIRQRYFREEEGTQILNEKTRSMVTFSYHNLIENNYPSLLTHTAGLDLILCRNVFIYFVRENVDRVMRKFINCLAPDGHVIVGVSDPVSLEVPGLDRCYEGGTSYFRKSGAGSPAKQQYPIPTPRPTRPVTATRQPTEARPSAASATFSSASPRPITPPAEVKPTAPRPSPTTPPPQPPAENPAAAKTMVVELIRAEDWPGVLTAVTTLEQAGQGTSDLLRAKVKALANMGRRQAAIEACEKLIELDSTDKHNQFLVGLVRLDNGDTDLAEKSLRRALFLDKDFLEAHYQLGMLMISRNKVQAGVRSLRNALALAEKTPEDQVMHEAAGTTAGRMAEVLRQYLAVYQAE